MPRRSPTRRVTAAIGCLFAVGCARPAGVAPTPANGSAVVRATSSAPTAHPWTDTTGHSPQTAIYRTWLRYLASTGGRYHRASFMPSPLWLASEQREWHVYALALTYLPDSAAPRVLSIEPDPDLQGQYRVVIRFTSPDENNAMHSRTATVTVYAVPADSGWALANALPRLTRTWRRDTVGPITYVMAPQYPFNRERAQRAAAFVDSLSSALGVPRPERLTYYLTSSDDEVFHIMGLDTDKKWGPVGGVAQPTNDMLFSGIPALGENYRHELTHIVVLPLLTGCTSYLISEGIPTWLGGTTGMDFPTAARGLATYLAEHPDVGLDSILAGRFPVTVFYPSGAVFARMTFDFGGTVAFKKLFDCGPKPGDFRAAMVHLFGRPWASIADEWRRQALAFLPAAAGEHRE